MAKLVDTHVHLNDPRYDENRDELIHNFEKDNILFAVNPGDTLETSESAVKLSNDYERIYAAVGIHPHSATTYNKKVEERLLELATENEKVVALGEFGLDFYRDYSPRGIQEEVFYRQLELAKKLDLPVLIHTRDAIQLTYDILEEYEGEVSGIMHSFSGSWEMAERFMSIGYTISLSGPVTFKNAPTLKEIARKIDLKDLVIETDSPYLTPEPCRGKMNRPSNVYFVAKTIAEERNIPIEEVMKVTTENAKRIFRI